jgi:uncharacterized iron-regulated membrane protein
MMTPRSWRQWHRWIGWIGAPFLLFAAITGIAVAISEFFGEAEAQREHLRTVVSTVTTKTSPAAFAATLERVFAAANERAPDAPIDRVEWQCKGEPPTITLCLGRRDGGEDRRLLFDAGTGRLVGEADYVDKPFLHRLHSGEAFGDGGLVAAMLWGLGLAALVGSGVVIYLQMRRRGAKGLQRVFW